MGIATVRCPECGSEVKMGLPQSSTIEAVAIEAISEPDDPRAKVRQNVCANGHECHVFFRF